MYVKINPGHKFTYAAESFFCRHHGFLLRHFIASNAMVLQENAVEGICQRLQCFFAYLRFQFALPYRNAVPTHRGKLLLHFQVAFLIPHYLAYPETPVGLRNLTAIRTFDYEL